MVVGGKDTGPAASLPKTKTEPQKVTLLTAARLMEDSDDEPFVLFPTDDTKRCYERQTLREFLADCMFFVNR